MDQPAANQSQLSAFRFPLSKDVPLFTGTEEALAYGRALPLVEFPCLVRTYFATQRALAVVQLEMSRTKSIADMDRFTIVATRQQLLREAIEAFIAAYAFAPSAVGHAAQGDPARELRYLSHETAAAEPKIAHHESSRREASEIDEARRVSSGGAANQTAAAEPFAKAESGKRKAENPEDGFLAYHGIEPNDEVGAS